MTFDEVLAQIIDLLQREKRVSYRALKLRFDINDNYIEGIKDELIYAKKLAVDEENRVLVWTGNIAGTIETPAPPPQSSPAPLPQVEQIVTCVSDHCSRSHREGSPLLVSRWSTSQRAVSACGSDYPSPSRVGVAPDAS